MKKVIVIGAGPAGIACSVQLKRFGIECIVFEKNKIGGLIRNANLIENYLGFPNGNSGPEFVKHITEQFNRHSIEFINEEIIDIKFEKNLFKVKSDKSYVYESEYLVIATGTVPKALNIDNAIKDKVFYEIAEIAKIKDKTIAIVGAGDAAFDYALNLSKYNQITILNRGSKIKALPLLVNRASKNKNIKYCENKAIQEIVLQNDKLRVLFNDNSCIFKDYLVAATGRVPDDGILTEKLKENPALCIIGDIKNGLLRQTSIAAADGLKAATYIYERINQN